MESILLGILALVDVLIILPMSEKLDSVEYDSSNTALEFMIQASLSLLEGASSKIPEILTTVLTGICIPLTTILNQREDKLLSGFLDNMVKDMNDALQAAHRLVEKVIRNCAEKLKPYLIHQYGNLIASIYQEKSDTVELNEPSTSGEHLVDGSKLSVGLTLYELPREHKKFKTEVDCLKDIDTLAENSSKIVQTVLRSRRLHPIVALVSLRFCSTTSELFTR